MSDHDSALQKMREALRGDVSTAIGTAFTILVIAGMLWAGTSLNQGYEAPEVVVLPTVWAAAIIGGVALTTIFAFLRYVNARASQEEGTEPESRTRDDPGNTTESGAKNSSTGRESQHDRQRARTLDVSGDGNAESPVNRSENAEKRAQENYPEWMQNEGNEQAGQSTSMNSEAVPPTQADSNPESERTHSSRTQKASDPNSVRKERENKSTTPPADEGSSDDQGTSVDSGEESEAEPQLTDSYFRNLRQSVVRNEFRR
jgi:hypothetical protein